jgi:hypothetical protein
MVLRISHDDRHQHARGERKCANYSDDPGSAEQIGDDAGSKLSLP